MPLFAHAHKEPDRSSNVPRGRASGGKHKVTIYSAAHRMGRRSHFIAFTLGFSCNAVPSAYKNKQDVQYSLDSLSTAQTATSPVTDWLYCT